MTVFHNEDFDQRSSHYPTHQYHKNELAETIRGARHIRMSENWFQRKCNNDNITLYDEIEKTAIQFSFIGCDGPYIWYHLY